MIILDGVSKRFEEKEVLKNLDLSFKEGETACILGASGCGKSTLMKIASGLMPPDSGRAAMAPSIRKSFIFQENRLLPWLDAPGNITYTGVPEERAVRYLELVGLGAEAGRLPAQLSGGMRRRLCIARALAFSGDCFFFDEPLQGLDKNTNDSMVSLIKGELGSKTALIITHSVYEAMAFASRIIIARGIPFEVLHDKPIDEISGVDELEKFIINQEEEV